MNRAATGALTAMLGMGTASLEGCQSDMVGTKVQIAAKESTEFTADGRVLTTEDTSLNDNLQNARLDMVQCFTTNDPQARNLCQEFAIGARTKALNAAGISPKAETWTVCQDNEDCGIRIATQPELCEKPKCEVVPAQ